MAAKRRSPMHHHIGDTERVLRSMVGEYEDHEDEKYKPLVESARGLLDQYDTFSGRKKSEKDLSPGQKAARAAANPVEEPKRARQPEPVAQTDGPKTFSEAIVAAAERLRDAA